MLNQRKVTTLFLLVWAVLFPLSAEAYVGPGLGAGTIGVVLGVLASVGLVLMAIVWYPVKRILKKIKDKRSGESVEDIPETKQVQEANKKNELD